MHTRARGRRLCGDERGIALVLALGILIVLAIVVAAGISYTTANTRATASSGGRLTARSAAESSVNTVVGILDQQLVSGADPSAANLLGCAGATGPNDPNGPSNCSSPTPKLLCQNGSSTCTAGAAGTSTVFGYYGGTNGGTYGTISVPPATWLRRLHLVEDRHQPIAVHEHGSWNWHVGALPCRRIRAGPWARSPS
jgi:Tfp pilus assembly protein PilX